MISLDLRTKRDPVLERRDYMGIICVHSVDDEFNATRAVAFDFHMLP